VLFTGINLVLPPGVLVVLLRATAGQDPSVAPPTGSVPVAAVTALVLVGGAELAVEPSQEQGESNV
jgi:hypothetical protein